jgi:protein involved in polysaccharide export with SLBB domain
MAGKNYPAPPPEFFESNVPGRSVVIAAGDVLTVRFYYNPQLNKTIRVRDDGKISLDLFQGILVEGKTPEELQKTLAELYAHEFTNPEVTVDLDARANNSVYVTGEVSLPGAKELHGKMTLAMVLAMSQMSQKTAGAKSVFLIRGMGDGKYHVYKLDAAFPSGTDRGLPLQAGDVLFVPRKTIVKVDDFIDQYVRQLVPATPTSNVGLIYTAGNPVLASTTTAAH